MHPVLQSESETLENERTAACPVADAVCVDVRVVLSGFQPGGMTCSFHASAMFST